MKNTLRYIALIIALTLAAASHAQTKTVLKNVTGNTITESLVIGSGKTLTIASGATINAASGSTITGFGSGGGPTALDDLTDVTITTATTGQLLRYNGSAWVNYTHGFLTSSDLSGYLTTATAASTYAPIASPTFTGTVTIPSGASISGYLTTATAASSYQPLDSDLTSIAALTTTSHGRSLLTDANASASRSTLGLGTIATQAANNVSITGGTIDIANFSTNSLSVVGVYFDHGNGTETSLVAGELFTDFALVLPTSGTSLLSDSSALNGSNISSGTVADARLSANVTLLGSAIALGSEVSGTLPIANGGTGETTASAARIALLPSMTSNGGKFLRVNAGATDYELATISGGGDALTTGTLDQFADVTQTATKTLAITESTTLNGGTHSGTNTGDQTTITGNAGTATALQTGRTINGTTFDGTANITVTAAAGTLTGSTLNATVTGSSLTSLGTIATGVWQGTAIADSYISSSATWNAKESALTFSTGLTRSTNTITVNTSQNIATLSNLTSNGFVKTSGGTGALSIDTTTYVANGGALGTPSSGTLTNCGSLPVSGITASTSTALGVGSIELGHASDTTLARSSAGVVTVEGNLIYRAGGSFTGLPVEIGVAMSDETTALTTGTAKITFRMPHAMTVTAVRLSLTTVSSSGLPTVDINETGTSILSTKLSCDVSEKTSTTATTAAVISDSALADDAEITIDIDTAGTGATGAKVWIIGTR